MAEEVTVEEQEAEAAIESALKAFEGQSRYEVLFFVLQDKHALATCLNLDTDQSERF